MQVRIYFIIVIITSVIVAGFKDEEIAALTIQHQALRQSLEEHKQPQRSRDDISSAQPIAHSEVSENALHKASMPIEIAEKIGVMESQLRQYRHEALGYQMMIDALKNEITLKDGELKDLRTSIAEYQSENTTLLARLAQKDADVVALTAREQNGSSELTEKLMHLTSELRLAEAEACYAKAQLTEIAGRKIYFSRVRKNEYLSEALEGYKKALALGKTEAARDIARLEKTLFPSLAAVAASPPPFVDRF